MTTDITQLIVWAFISYGMTTILVYGSIFNGIRNFLVRKSHFFGTLVTCPLCLSTWVGFTMSYITGGISAQYFDFTVPYSNIFMDGVMTAGLVWGINSIIEFFEENRIK